MCVCCHVWCQCVFEVICGVHVCLMSYVVPMCDTNVWCPCVFEVMGGAHMCYPLIELSGSVHKFVQFRSRFTELGECQF